MIRDEPTLRACIDCKWFRQGDQGYTCTNPKHKRFDRVHGWQEQQAEGVRTDGACGMLGKDWEPRSRPLVPDYLGIALSFGFLFYLIWMLFNYDK